MCLFWPIYGSFGVVTEYSSPEPGMMGWHSGLSLRKIALQIKWQVVMRQEQIAFRSSLFPRPPSGLSRWQECLIFVPEWCVSVLPNVSESFQAGPLFPTGFGREHDRQVAVPCCVLILQDDFPTLCDTNAYEHLRKNLRKNAGEIYLFNESITCRTKRADNFLHFDSLTSMINCYCSTI